MSASDMFAARLNALTFSYDGSHMMNFDCTFERGKTTAIMGASGSGKSTMLALIAGFEVPLSGSIELDGKIATDLTPAERPLSMVFQSNNLFAHMNTTKNVALGISPDFKLSVDSIAQVEAALEAVGLAGFGDRLPSALSGGQRQRVALARVLIRKRPILLLDEAFASLGPGLREEMLDLVASLSAENRLTTIMVTHAPEDALRIAEQLIFIDNGTVALSGQTTDILTEESDEPLIRDYLGGKSL